MGRQSTILWSLSSGKILKLPSRLGFGIVSGLYFHLLELTFYLEISALPVVLESTLSPWRSKELTGWHPFPGSAGPLVLDVGFYPGCLHYWHSQAWSPSVRSTNVVLCLPCPSSSSSVSVSIGHFLSFLGTQALMDVLVWCPGLLEDPESHVRPSLTQTQVRHSAVLLLLWALRTRDVCGAAAI